jgi:hypothetical protein
VVVAGAGPNEPPDGGGDGGAVGDDAGDERAGEPDRSDMAPEEEAVLDAFDRLRPQGSLEWCFEDAMRRLDRPDLDSAAAAYPWRGLPDDLWERGRSARIGRRFGGEVTAALAQLMAEDARAAADAAVSSLQGDRFVAAWDALRFLAARVEALEARQDPTGVVTADYDLALPDSSAWSEALAMWLGEEVAVDGPLVVGEARDAALVTAATRTGRQVCAVEPRGVVVWEALAAGDPPAATFVLAEVGDHLPSMDDASAAGVVLAGCVDRVDLVAKAGLARQALRVTRGSGRVVVLATDQKAWDRQVAPPARDLLPGRPLHPETWSLLLRRFGADSVVWHRPPGDGPVHAIVAEVGW